MRINLFLKKITIPVILIFATVHSSFASDREILAVTISDSILISNNDGKSWDSFSKGLPSDCRPLRFYTNGSDTYLATYASGLFRLEGNKWINISSDDFRRRSIYSKNAGYRKISAFAIDPADSRNLVTATKHTIYRSRDRGASWQKLPMSGLNRRSYITALAITGDRVYAGTSFNGVLELSGGEFKPAGNSLPAEPYSATMKFTEQIASLGVDKNNLYAGFQFGGGLYKRSLNAKNFEPLIKSSDSNFNSIIYDLKNINGSIYFSDGKKIMVSSNNSVSEDAAYNPVIERIAAKPGICNAAIIEKENGKPSLSLWINNPENKISGNSAAGRKAIYISIPAIQRNLAKYIEMSKSAGIDTFVIDMKDDFGNIYFPTESKVASEIKAVRKPLNIKAILEKLKSNGIYSVARIVTFKDEKLYNGYNGKYAIKNRDTGATWKGAPGEFWVDPYSEFVHDYNISLAMELEKSGFNEIQFDYIRFPSDGPLHLCKFSFQSDQDTYKSEILIDFLKKAKHSLNIPVSVDIYGFNSWYYFGNMIGQDMEDLSWTVDVICPMVYPSHFGGRFYGKYNQSVRPYRLLLDGGIRAMKMVNRRILLRPYIQGFNLMSPTWGPGYIRDQIKGAGESGCSGYTIWNAKGDYDVPYKALKEK